MKRISPLILLSILVFSGCTLPFSIPLPLQPTGPAEDPRTAIAKTLTAWPTSTVSSVTPPTATGLPATVTPSTLPPTTTLTPTILLPSLTPDQFIRYYFDNINVRNYTLTWSLLSERFKAAINSPDQGGYAGYVKFWNSVKSVNIENVTVVSLNGDYAAIKVKMVIRYNNGVVTPTTIAYTLVFDHIRNSWLFDTTPPPTSTASRTATRTATPTKTPTGTPAASQTASPTPSGTPTPSQTTSFTPSDTPSPSPTETETSTPSPTPSETPTPTST